MKLARWLASLCFILVSASLSGLLTKAPGADDRDEPVVLPIVKTASTDQPAIKLKGVTLPEPACVDRDLWLSDCPTPTKHPRPQAPDPSPFA